MSAQFNDQTRSLFINVEGKWAEIILYEIPILSIVSEAYFKFVDTEWDHVAQYERAFCKAERLIREGCQFAEFGGRRRRDYKTQEIVLRGLIAGQKALIDGGYKGPGRLTGTSNVHFAHKLGLTPIGTLAHEM